MNSNKKYNHKIIEEKWQKYWKEHRIFEIDSTDFSKPKFYALVEFPYPSGQGLHVGHPRSYTALDIVSRKRRLQGYNVLYPMGWDAFGLPTENFAIKNNIHPKLVTEKNIQRFRKQLESLGLSFDWSKEVNTTSPEYYKWTQWIFLKLFEHGLAYKSKSNVNWCTSCKCVLANEEVIGGKCERCGNDVIHKDKAQWMLKITAYAQRLIDDLENLDYPERVKLQQKNWIGRSEGAQVNFDTTVGEPLAIYTTRPDTIFGCTYMVISPEHPFIDKYKKLIKNIDEINKYRDYASKKSDFERVELSKEKTGVKIEGICAVNPVNKKKVPIFVSDYVLMSYGTGSIMAVPAHDERDNEFAKKYDMPIIDVISNEDSDGIVLDGIMINSEFLNGMGCKEAKARMIDWLENNNIGHRKVNYKLRDWVFSRQRYWGEPIPIVICDKCGYVPISEEELPLKLPEIDSYKPTDNGESPLINAHDWVNTTCPKCGRSAVRETDTMPQWAGSSWYFLRYLDPKNDNVLADKKLIDYWMPVDWYNGGMEHTTLHLLYSRFWYKFLYDIGVVPTSEPYARRTSHGMILGENGEKMSKSRGNVVNPDDIINEYGADTMRIYEMFIGDFEKAAPWSQDSIRGSRRFLERVWALQYMVSDSNGIRHDLDADINLTIKKVSEDIENLKFNTAIAALMTLLNKIYDLESITKEELNVFLVLLSPFAPHISDEILSIMDLPLSSQQEWPVYDENKCKKRTIEMVVQINGKIKMKVNVPYDSEKAYILDIVNSSDSFKNLIKDKKIIKEYFVPNKLINIVVK